MSIRNRKPTQRKPAPRPLSADVASAVDYLTRREVAHFMRVDIQAVDYCIKHRGLKAYRFGRRVLVKRADLDAYLLANRANPF